MSKPQFLTVAQTAELLSISPRAAQKLAQTRGVAYPIPIAIVEEILQKREDNLIVLIRRTHRLRRQVITAQRLMAAWQEKTGC